MTHQDGGSAPRPSSSNPVTALRVIGMGVMGQTLLKGLLDAQAIRAIAGLGATSRSRATCDKVAAAAEDGSRARHLVADLAQTDVLLLGVKPAQAGT